MTDGSGVADSLDGQGGSAIILVGQDKKGYSESQETAYETRSRWKTSMLLAQSKPRLLFLSASLDKGEYQNKSTFEKKSRWEYSMRAGMHWQTTGV